MSHASPSLSTIPFRFVQHNGPEDWLHYESAEASHDWTIPAHRHDGLHQFQLIEKGNCQLSLDGIERPLKGPLALMLPPGTVHGFTWLAGCSSRQVTVPSDYLREALHHCKSLATWLDSTILIDGSERPAAFEACAALFDGIAMEFSRQEPGRREVLKAHSMHLTVWFARNADPKTDPVRRAAARDTLVQRYLSMLDEHFRERLPLSYYADRFGVTPDHLSRICKLIKGYSALELLHERRYIEARRMLAYTNTPVNEVADLLGFEDSGYFSRFFSRRCGQSPMAFRYAFNHGTLTKA